MIKALKPTKLVCEMRLQSHTQTHLNQTTKTPIPHISACGLMPPSQVNRLVRKGQKLESSFIKGVRSSCANLKVQVQNTTLIRWSVQNTGASKSKMQAMHSDKRKTTIYLKSEDKNNVQQCQKVLNILFKQLSHRNRSGSLRFRCEIITSKPKR